jgi:spermidine synthase
MKGPADAKNGKDAAAAPREGRRELRELLNPGQGMFYYAGDTLVEARTAYQRAEIVDSEALGRVLLLDGVSQLAERWEYRYHEPMVHPALLAHPNPRTVLVIGGGTGACSARSCCIKRLSAWISPNWTKKWSLSAARS